jgi:hypothetical protein
MENRSRTPASWQDATALVLAALALNAALATPAFAQNASRATVVQKPATRQLQREIATVPVAEIARIPTDTVAAPAGPASTAAADASTAPEAAPAATDPAPAATAPSSVAEVRPLSTLQRGRLYYARVSPEQETRISEIVEPTIRATAGDRPVMTIPGVVRVLSRAGDEVQLKPYVFFGDRLTYSATARKFVGSIFVGVASIGEREDQDELSAPVIFQVLESFVVPQQISVTRTSPPYARLDVALDSIGGQENGAENVRILTTYSPDVMTLSLPVAPTVLVRVTSPSIQGYGLGTTPVSVSVLGMDNPEGRTVTLTASPRATFEPVEITLDKFGNGRSLLRSDGVGQVLVGASLANAVEIPSTVTFMPPTETVGAGLIGGLGGALIRLLPRIGRIGAKKFVLGIFVSILIGLLVFGLYAIGVKVLPIEPTVSVGAIVVLVISAVGAWLGTSSLRGLAPAR